MQRAGDVANGEDERRPAAGPGRRDEAGNRGTIAGKDGEARPILVAGLDVVGEDLEAEEVRHTGRRDRRSTAFMTLGDRPSGTGGVVRREDLPLAGAQERVSLDERLGVAVHALDPLERLSRQGQERKAYRDGHLA